MKFNIELYNKLTGRQLVSTNFQGKVYAVVEPHDVGSPFYIRVYNYTWANALAVVAVDGCSVLSGETASKQDGGYILGSREHYDIMGWRRGNDHVAEFVFTGLEASYAALTGRPNNVGVIGVAFYEEMAKPRPKTNQVWGSSVRNACNFDGEAEYTGGVLRSLESGSPKRVGTGYGSEVSDKVVNASFVKNMRSMIEFNVYYNTREQLTAWGIPLPMHIDLPKAFPADQKSGNFVPAP